MEQVNKILSGIGFVSGALSWGSTGAVDVLAKVATIICAANLLLSWAFKAYARIKAVKDGKKTPEQAAEEFLKEAQEGKHHGKND